MTKIDRKDQEAALCIGNRPWCRKTGGIGNEIDVSRSRNKGSVANRNLSGCVEYWSALQADCTDDNQGGDMEITRVIGHVLMYDLPEELGYSQQFYSKRSAHVVEIQTDEGVTGWGECLGPRQCCPCE